VLALVVWRWQGEGVTLCDRDVFGGECQQIYAIFIVEGLLAKRLHAGVGRRANAAWSLYTCTLGCRVSSEREWTAGNPESSAVDGDRDDISAHQANSLSTTTLCVGCGSVLEVYVQCLMVRL
jgi:hypothetical protein